MSAGPIRIVLADDHELVLEGLRSLLDAEPDMEVVSVATDGDELLHLLDYHDPDVVVLDLEMGNRGGLSCLEEIRARELPVRVLVLTAYSDGATMRHALEAGADGYVLKTEPPRQTVASVRQVGLGRMVFPQAARRFLLGAREDELANGKKLTEREAEVLVLVAEGHTNGRIAARLKVSENTVKFHLQNIFQKLGIHNRTEAAAYHFKHHSTES